MQFRRDGAADPQGPNGLSDMIATGRKHFIPGLESARGLAALFVCGLHSLHSLQFWPRLRLAPINPQLLAFFTGAGNSAVTFFFVLSGFVLTLALDKMKADGRGALSLSFIVSRIFRIYPAVLVVVFAYAALEPQWILHGVAGRPLATTLGNAFLLQSTMILPTWSTRVEVAATPLILAAWYLRGRFGARGLAALGALLLIGSFLRSLYAADEIGRNLFVFVVGMLLADSGAFFRRLRPALAIAVIVAAMLVDIPARTMLGLEEQATIVVEAACCFLMVGMIAYEAVPIRWLQAGALRLLGRISYSFYLVHYMIIYILPKCLPESALLALSFGNSTVASIEMFAIVAILSAAVAWGLYWSVERPGIFLGKKSVSFGQRIGRANRSRAPSPAIHAAEPITITIPPA